MSMVTIAGAAGPGLGKVRSLAPGLLLTLGIAWISTTLTWLPGMGVMSPAAIAMGVGFLARPAASPAAAAGIQFSSRVLLRLAIILLGLRLTVGQIGELGAAGAAIIGLSLVGTLVFTTWLGRVLKVDRVIAELIAAGTSICGASAIAAANTVSRGEEADVAYAVACISLFGTLAMLAAPLLVGVTGLTPEGFALWTGAAIHEIGQVAGAASMAVPAHQDFAMLSKLTRVLMLAPVIAVLSALALRRAARGGAGPEQARAGRAPFPLFLLGFAAMVGLNSLVPLPHEAARDVATLTNFLLAAALAGMGLSVDFSHLKAKGPRPLVLAGAATLFISGFSLALVTIFW